MNTRYGRGATFAEGRNKVFAFAKILASSRTASAPSIALYVSNACCSRVNITIPKHMHKQKSKGEHLLPLRFLVEVQYSPKGETRYSPSRRYSLRSYANLRLLRPEQICTNFFLDLQGFSVLFNPKTVLSGALANTVSTQS